MSTNKTNNIIFPGTFDPLHSGHIDIIKRASKIFDKVYVAVSTNIYKKNANNIDYRYNKVKKKILRLNINNVFVIKNTGLTVDLAKKYKCHSILRSIRNEKDAIYERNIAQSNFLLNKNIETILMISKKNLEQISSTAKKFYKDINKYKKNIK